MTTLRFCVFGDVHGQQNLMYARAEQWEQESGKKFDVILQVGDFQTIRSEMDFDHYYAPVRHQRVSDIADYCKGLLKAPTLTLFIAGNHESWSVLKNEGNFICPDVLYLGRAGIMKIGDVVIGGLSGIFSRRFYNEPLSEQPSDLWKYYRRKDVERLEREKVDILLLHEWPHPVDENFEILQEEDILPDLKTGAPTPAYNLLRNLKPRFAFAGHTHKSFIEARLNDTIFVGLKQMTETKPKGSMYVAEITV